MTFALTAVVSQVALRESFFLMRLLLYLYPVLLRLLLRRSLSSPA